MKSDAVYFPHFSNARNDRKIKRVIKELGIEGYGIYFMLLETLRDQPGMKYPVSDIDLLADEFGTSEQKVRTVVSNYGLFLVDDGEEFFSVKLIEYLTPMLERRKQAKRAVEIRWEKERQKKLEQKQDVDTDVLPENYASNTKKRKEKKRKEKKKYYGAAENVLLSDPELEKLKQKFPTSYNDKIDNLSHYVASKGRSYKSHYHTILSWDRKDRKEDPSPVGRKVQ